jgi:hypothetical protein
MTRGRARARLGSDDGHAHRHAPRLLSPHSRSAPSRLSPSGQGTPALIIRHRPDDGQTTPDTHQITHPSMPHAFRSPDKTAATYSKARRTLCATCCTRFTRAHAPLSQEFCCNVQTDRWAPRYFCLRMATIHGTLISLSPSPTQQHRLGAVRARHYTIIVDTLSTSHLHPHAAPQLGQPHIKPPLASWRREGGPPPAHKTTR